MILEMEANWGARISEIECELDVVFLRKLRVRNGFELDVEYFWENRELEMGANSMWSVFREIKG